MRSRLGSLRQSLVNVVKVEKEHTSISFLGKDISQTDFSQLQVLLLTIRAHSDGVTDTISAQMSKLSHSESDTHT